MYKKIGLAAITLVSLVAAAQANTVRQFSGTDCIGHAAPDMAVLGRMSQMQTACFNAYPGGPVPNVTTGTCGPDMLVALPITGNNSDTVDYDTLTVNYSNTNLAEAISCTAFVMNAAGTVFASASRSSDIASFPVFPVTGALTWTGASLPNGGNAIPGVSTQTIFCAIPSTWWLAFVDPPLCGDSDHFSAVVNYVVDTVQP